MIQLMRVQSPKMLLRQVFTSRTRWLLRTLEDEVQGYYCEQSPKTRTVKRTSEKFQNEASNEASKDGWVEDYSSVASNVG